jgi:nicotinamidase-related amidase
MSYNIHLLAIDCQRDFTQPKNPKLADSIEAVTGITADSKFVRDGGSLFVLGADKDMKNLTAFINRMGNKITKITATLDSHYPMQVFHPLFWRNSKGDHPSPFTMISVSDVKNAIWSPSIAGLHKKAIDYVQKLSDQGSDPLIIWPEHTLISSIGHGLDPDLFNAMNKWARDKKSKVNWAVKGDFYMSEHYGALKAEVEYPEEPSTHLNTNIIGYLQSADVILIAGEALSHCVRKTVTQIAETFGEENIKKFVLLEDCCSNVTGFEKLGADFVSNMTKRGMKVAKSTEYLT